MINVGDLVMYDFTNYMGETSKGFGYVKGIQEEAFIIEWISISGWPENVFDWRTHWLASDFASPYGTLKCIQ